MAFQYELSFAGIPFVSDKGIAIQMGQVGNPFVENDLQTPRKHQVLSTLYEEINRIIPIELFQEFAPCTPSSYVDSLSTSPKQPMEVRLGEFFYPHGMSRWGVFRGLATTSIATAMLAATGGTSPATFNLKSVPLSPDNPSGGNNTGVWSVSTNMYMMPPRCLADHGGQFEGLYLITLVDDRFFVQSSVTNLNITSLQTWEAVIVQLALDLGFSVSLASSISSVYGRPEPDSQLWVAGSQEAATLLDCVALNVGRSVVRNYDGNFVLYTPAESYAIALDNRGSDNPVRVAGGSFYALSNSVKAALPSEINVTFPKYIVGNDPVPHFYNPRYTSPRPTAWVEDSYGECYTITVPIADTGVGTTGISQWTIESVSKALYDTESAAGASPTNRSFLLALSNRLATDRAQFQAYAFLDEVYPGTFAWEPEGLHDITWTYSERKGLASTRVTRYPWDEVMSKTSQHATFAGDASFGVAGVGGRSVAQTWKDSANTTAYGVNLVTLETGLNITSAPKTNGGVQEVKIGLDTQSIIQIFNFPPPPNSNPTNITIWIDQSDNTVYIWNVYTESWSVHICPCPPDALALCECTQCPDGAPSIWILTVSVPGTAAYETLAGTFVLRWVSGCYWRSNDTPDGVNWELNYVTDHWELVGYLDGGVNYVIFDLSVLLCCSANIFTYVSDVLGTWTTPTALTLNPYGPCGPCVDYTAICTCSLCPDGVPAQWVVSLPPPSDATYAVLGGSFLLDYDESCQWSNIDADGNGWVLLGLSGNNAQLQGYYNNGASVINYNLNVSGSFNCCDSNVMIYTGGDGGIASSITVFPYGDCVSCDPSDDGTIETTCCANLLPATLYAHVTGGSCNGDVFRLIWIAPSNAWMGAADTAIGTCSPIPEANIVELYCVGSSFEFATYTRANTYTPTAMTCNPFSVSFTGVDLLTCCDSTISITITGTP